MSDGARNAAKRAGLLPLVLCAAFVAVADEPREDTFVHLFRAMQVKDEPSVKDSCNESYAALRFFEYDASGPKGLIRVEQIDDRIRYTYRVFAVESGPATSTRVIDADDWQRLIDKFVAGGFWESSSDSKLWVPDATTWLFESCIDGAYHSLQSYPDRDLRMNDAVGALVALKL